MKIFNPYLSATEATATADATNAGTIITPNVMTGMTLTPVAGTYLIDFTSTVDHSNQSVAVTVSVFIAGAQKTDTVRSVVPRPNALGANSLTMEVAISTIGTVDGSQAIDIRWGTTAGTATVHQRTLRIVRIT